MYYIKSEDQVKLAVYDLNSRSKKVIVMIHGWPLSAEMFEYQKEYFIQQGYRIVCMDLRGFGRSDVPASGYTYDQMADDLYRVVRARQLHRFTLLGFSMGGAIAVRYMARYRGYGVNKLCLCAAAVPSFTDRPGFPYGMAREHVDDLIVLAKADRPELCQNFSLQLFASPHNAAVIEWFRFIALSASGIGTVRCAYALRDEDCSKDLGQIHVPTGIFHGEKDDIVPFAAAEVTHEAIPGSTLFPFANSSHGIVYDELALFNHTLLEFLSA